MVLKQADKLCSSFSTTTSRQVKDLNGDVLKHGPRPRSHGEEADECDYLQTEPFGMGSSWAGFSKSGPAPPSGSVLRETFPFGLKEMNKGLSTQHYL